MFQRSVTNYNMRYTSVISDGTQRRTQPCVKMSRQSCSQEAEMCRAYSKENGYWPS